LDNNEPKQAEITEEKCLECRECCEYVEVPYTMYDNDTMEFFITRGTQIFIQNNGVAMVRFHQPCVHITEKGCDIYENRPEVCKRYACVIGDKGIIAMKEKNCAESAERIMKLIKQSRETQNKDTKESK